MSCRAVLFDLDGTLHDRAATLAAFLPDQARRFAGRLGDVTPAAWVAQFLALDDRGRTPKEEVYPALLAAFGGEQDLARALVDDYYRTSPTLARPMPAMAVTLTAARGAGLRLAIVSNGRAGLQDSVIATLELEAMVDAVLVSERESVRKPAAELFLRAACRLGVAPAACLFVGDDPVADILGASGAGMAAAWLSGGAPWPGGLPSCPGAAIASLADIGTLLGF